jgi:hypothetical protein
MANLEIDHREFRIRSSRGLEENLITTDATRATAQFHHRRS